MLELLLSPMIITALLPFALAVVLNAVLPSTPLGLSGWWLAVAFWIPAWVIESGFSLSLSSNIDRIIVVGLAAWGLGLLADASRVLAGSGLEGASGRRLFNGGTAGSDRLRTGVFALAAGMVGVWVAAPLIGRSSGAAAVWLAAGAFAYPAWITGWMCAPGQRTIRRLNAGWVLATSTGACAVLAASARLGQLGLALGLAAAGTTLVAVIRPRLLIGDAAGLMLGVIAALIGFTAAAFGYPPFNRLPPLALVALALIPALAAVPLPERGRLVESLLLVACMAPAALVALWLVAAGMPAAGSGYG